MKQSTKKEKHYYFTGYENFAESAKLQIALLVIALDFVVRSINLCIN